MAPWFLTKLRIIKYCTPSLFLLAGVFFFSNKGIKAQTEDSLAAPMWLTLSQPNIVAGSTFWIDVHVGTDAIPVEGLFGISFKVRYSHVEFIAFDKAIDDEEMRGDFLVHPDTTLFLKIPDYSRGIVSIAHSRKYPAEGVRGAGIVARLPFGASVDLPDSTNIIFELFDAKAETKDAESIALAVESTTQFLALQPEDFFLSLQPDSIELNKGQSRELTLKARSAGGFVAPIQLTSSPFIAGLDVQIQPAQIVPGQTAKVTITAGEDITPDHYNITFTGRSDTLSHNVNAFVSVDAIPVSIISDTSTYFSTEPFKIRIELGDQNRKVENLSEISFLLDVTNKPFIVLPQASQVQIAANLASSFLIDKSELTNEQKIQFVVKAKDTGESFNGFGDVLEMEFNTLLETPEDTRLDFTLENVQALDINGEKIVLSERPLAVTIKEKNQFFFTLAADSVEVTAGHSTKTTAQIRTNPSFSNGIHFSVVNAPQDLQVTFSPVVLNGSGNAEIELIADSTLNEGVYTLQIQASSGETQEQMLVVNVLPFYDFNLHIKPAFTEIHGGDSASFYISISGDNPADEPVFLQISGLDNIPDLEYFLNKPQLGWGDEALLEIRTRSTVRPRRHQFQVHGTVSDIHRFANCELTILQPPPPVLPNPFTPNGDGFNDEVTFKFPELQNRSGRVLIFDINGRKIIELSNSLVWTGVDENGKALSPGAYLYVVEAGDEILARGVIGLAK